jgi:hypothetical protein
MLVVSSFDKKIALKSKKDATTYTKQPASRFPEVRNIFQDLNENSSNFKSIHTEFEKEFDLFRFLLRRNSTKIKPSTWQRENLCLESKSSWLASFVSPLYVESPYDEVGSVSL